MKAIAPLKIIVRMQIRGDSESSVPALSESLLTFIPKTILRGAMVLQSKCNFFCGHPVYVLLLMSFLVFSQLSSCNLYILKKILKLEQTDGQIHCDTFPPPMTG